MEKRLKKQKMKKNIKVNFSIILKKKNNKKRLKRKVILKEKYLILMIMKMIFGSKMKEKLIIFIYIKII